MSHEKKSNPKNLQVLLNFVDLVELIASPRSAARVQVTINIDPILLAALIITT